MDRIKTTVKEKEESRRKESDKLQELYRTVYTSKDVVETLGRLNIPLVDFESIGEDVENELVLDADVAEEELVADEGDGEPEDEDVDYDEPGESDPFDTEKPELSPIGIYVAEVRLKNGTPSVLFLQTPAFDGREGDTLVRDALLQRLKTLKAVAVFIAERQKAYFAEEEATRKWEGLAGLNQTDVVEYLESLKTKSINIDKAHFTKMLDSLYFRIKGLGDIPAKSLFKRRGGDFTEEERDDLAREFLALGKQFESQTEAAKEFWGFVKEKTGIEIALSDKAHSDGDRYRRLRDILKKAKGE